MINKTNGHIILTIQCLREPNMKEISFIIIKELLGEREREREGVHAV